MLLGSALLARGDLPRSEAALLRAVDLDPRGFWGWVEDRTSLRLLPVGYRLRLPNLNGTRALPTTQAVSDAITGQDGKAGG